MSPYTETFKDWQFLDINLTEAMLIVQMLTAAGAGFACTSEASVGRRIYFTSDSSTNIVHGYLEKYPR